MKKTTYNTWVKLTLLAIGVYCMITLWLLPITNPLIEDLVDTIGAVLFYNFIILFIAAVYLWANPNKLTDTDVEIEQELEKRRMHNQRYTSTHYNLPYYDEDDRGY